MTRLRSRRARALADDLRDRDRPPALPLALVGGFHEGEDLDGLLGGLTGGLPVLKNLTISTTSGS